MQNWLASLIGGVLNQQCIVYKPEDFQALCSQLQKFQLHQQLWWSFFKLNIWLHFLLHKNNLFRLVFRQILVKYTVVLDKFRWTLVNSKVFKFNQCKNKKLHAKSGLVSLTWSGMFHLSVQNHCQALHTVPSFQATLMHKSCQDAYP